MAAKRCSAVEDHTLAGEADTLADEANALADEKLNALADEALTLAWNYMLLLHRDERSLAEFGLSLQDIKSIGRTCSGARDAVTNDPCWQVDVFGRTDADVRQWPLFSPAELYDLGPGTVIWAWIEKKWYRGTLSLDASYDDQIGSAHGSRGWEGLGLAAGWVWERAALETGSCVCRETTRAGRPRLVRAIFGISS